MTGALVEASARIPIDRLRTAAIRLGAVAVGAVNYDEIFLLDGAMRDDGAAHVAEKQLFAGGHAANCASALVRLGFAASVVGAVGDDAMGRWLIEDLRARSIDVSGIATVGAPTGRAIIPVFSDGHFMILERGANEFATEVPHDVLSGPSMIALFDPPLKMLDSLADWLAARPDRPDVYWTPGGHYVAHDIVGRLLPYLRTVFVNRAEAVDLRRLHAQAMCEAPSTRVIETHGAAGAICHHAGVRHHAPGYLTDCVDPIGAGDHFAACFMLADQARLPIMECLAIGNIGGMMAVETVGARAGDFGIDRLEREVLRRGIMR